jgi:hypothetical protein
MIGHAPIYRQQLSPQGISAMSAFLSRITNLVDSVLGLDAACGRFEGNREVPSNMFSGFMIFGCRQVSR